MSKNNSTTSWSKHVDVRTKFVNKFCEDGIVKIIFVKSQDNDSDILTKNLASELHKKHSAKLVKFNPMVEYINYEKKKKTKKVSFDLEPKIME